MNTDINILRFTTEKQTFDRKSARIDAKALAILLIAFANADGGTIAIGIEDKGEITGIDGYTQNINELLRAPFDFCVPTVAVDSQIIECTDREGKPNHILLMHVFPSSQLHANQADEVFYRVGDKSKKMNFEQRMRLLYAKGGRYFEDQPVYNATVDDIDLDFAAQYVKKIGYGKGPLEYLRGNKDYIVTRNGHDEISGAAILLFGKYPQRFFQRARVRFIRYNGTQAKVGTEMNVIKDVVFEGKILDMVQKSTEFVKNQMREYSFLGNDGRFITIPELPEFCWMELIINAIGHRDYSISGTDIQIKMFDDHFTVESPGMLPGLVRTSNIREIHFSRNPKIIEFLHTYEYVKEFGEGVDRMFREMEAAGLPEPEYKTVEFMVYGTLKNHNWKQDTPQDAPQDTPQDAPQDTNTDKQKILEYCTVPRSQAEIRAFMGLSDRRNFRKNYLRPLIESGELKMTIPDKPSSRYQKYVKADPKGHTET